MKRARTDGLRSDVWTVPNLISFFRILLAPVFVWAVLNHRSREALIIFFVAGVSDFLDGLAARMLDVRTKLGMILDPAGDKLLMAAATILLTIRPLARPNALPLALTLLIFGRDLLIAAGALIAYLGWRQTTFPPSLLGKFSTAFQMGTVFLVLLLNDLGKAPGWMAWFYILTAALTFGSGVDYFLYGLRTARERRARRA
ncbi:MAG: CDP-alcohol phosphatidyltransferase family protein [Candidatus Aminicenantes bacterium]|nr:CDP-alcohol phosphatidyltransferase family protein [Candidatus Aminicenantes bacterium]